MYAFANHAQQHESGTTPHLGHGLGVRREGRTGVGSDGRSRAAHDADVIWYGQTGIQTSAHCPECKQVSDAEDALRRRMIGQI